MKPRHARANGSQTGRVETASADTPELPTGKAFVLQLSRETGPGLATFAGRLEHLVSGRRLRFVSFATFRAAVIRLLTETKQ